MSTVVRLQPARMFRGKIPICWMLSMLQSLGVCDWPPQFGTVTRNPNLLQDIFTFIKRLRFYGPNLSANQNRRIAKLIVSFINQQKLSGQKKLDTDQHWSIYRQQDASEFLQYFFNLFADPAMAIEADISKMKNYLRTKVGTVTTNRINCPCGNYVLETNPKHANVNVNSLICQEK